MRDLRWEEYAGITQIAGTTSYNTIYNVPKRKHLKKKNERELF